MKLSISPSKNRRNIIGSTSTRFFKSAVLCAFAYALGLSSRDFHPNSVLIDNGTATSNAVKAKDSPRRSNAAAAQSQTIREQTRRVKTTGNRPEIPKTTSSLAKAKGIESKPSSSTSNALNLIPNDQLQLLDYFSDSWLLNRENFLKVPLDQIGIVEDACLAAIGKRRIHDHSKMFVDWTDFMVMHLSKWWGELSIMGDSDSAMFDHTTYTILGGYLRKILSKKSALPPRKSPLHPTIAMIAFAPYKSHHANRGELLTAHSLASTIASLYQVGFGRVIVTCNGESDETRAHEAFRLVHLYASADADKTVDTQSIFNSDNIPIQIGNTELAAVKIANQTWFTTKWVKYNMPRAAVLGMQHALGGMFEDASDTEYWLGRNHEKSYWKYVYLTEPDTLLHTKESMWKHIQEGLDQGLSFFPHRLQPLPHEVNLPPSKDSSTKKHISKSYQSSYLPNNVHPFSNITVLDETMHCCDGGSEWPGRSEEFGTKQQPCGYWWWGCGYRKSIRKPVVEHSNEEILENHKRLVPYPMMTIAKGTGVVFGPTEMGRRCFPSRTPCPRSQS